MLYLFLSIFLSAYLGVAFAVINKYKIDLFQTIVFNYWTCVITGSIVLGSFPLTSQTLHESWFSMAIVMGAMFILIFNVIAISSVKVGVTITQTANKLSLIIPVIVSIFAYHENVSIIKVIGIFLALVAVVLTTNKSGESKQNKIASWEYFLPILLFVGSGIIDTLTKYVQRTYIKDEATANAYLISGFMIAAIIGTAILLFMYITKRKTFSNKNVIAGVIIGVPNYFSIYYLIKALENKSLSSTATIPINNIGILFVVSVFGIFILKEKLTRLNYIGLLLTLLAIFFIFIGDK